MKTKTGFQVSPRSVALSEGYELVDTSPGEGETTYCFEHPETKVGLLITSRKEEAIGTYVYDWSIHEPQTYEVIEAKWGEPDGTSFLRFLRQLAVDDSPLTDVSFTTAETSEPLQACKSCRSLRVLDSNGFCYSC